LDGQPSDGELRFPGHCRLANMAVRDKGVTRLGECSN